MKSFVVAYRTDLANALFKAVEVTEGSNTKRYDDQEIKQMIVQADDNRSAIDAAYLEVVKNQ